MSARASRRWGEDLNAKFEGQITMLRFKLEKDGGSVKVVGGERGGDLTYSHRPGGGRVFTLRPNKAHRAGAAKAR